MRRPKDLPEFDNPPLNEVVLGVQFEPIPNQTNFDAYDFWNIFKAELPRIEEHPPLPPIFETFGSTPNQNGLQIQFGSGKLPSRFWFVSEDDNHLVQFQPDKLLLNWRKRKTSDSYPRFEQIFENFANKLNELQIFLESQRSHFLEINQVEVTYLNIIEVDNFAEFGNWFKFWNQLNFNLEHINISFPEIIFDSSGKPFSRLHHEIVSAFEKNGSGKAFRLNLTFRGRPDSSRIEDALELIKKGRAEIVNRFAEITTPEAHLTWRKLT